MDYGLVPNGHLAIGTQLLSHRPAATEASPEKASPEKASPEKASPERAGPEQAGDQWAEHVPPPGRDATLLAVVPIPGTQTSLAIVGYAIATSSTEGPGSAASQPALRAEPAKRLLIDHVQRRVWIDGAEVTLTFQEFELLAFLNANPATVFSRADLLRRVWSDTPDRRNVRRNSRTVDVHVSRLRRKLGPVHGQCLVTEHRAGYQFRPPAL